MTRRNKSKSVKPKKCKASSKSTNPLFDETHKIMSNGDRHVCSLVTCQKIKPLSLNFHQTVDTVKFFINLEGVEGLPKSNIKIKIDFSSLYMDVFELMQGNHHLHVDVLSHSINPEKSRFFIKKDKIFFVLAKLHKTQWRYIEKVVDKADWLMYVCSYLDDIAGPDGRRTFVRLASEVWEDVCEIEASDFNILKLPSKFRGLFPNFKFDESNFKNLEQGMELTKQNMQKWGFNEPSFVILGVLILRKMTLEKIDKHAEKKIEIINDTVNCATPKSEKATKAEQKKTEGNYFYEKSQFYAALQLYLEAIKLDSNNSVFHYNASASYMMLGLYPEALKMAQKAVDIDPLSLKCLLRLGKCYLALGQVKACSKTLNKAKDSSKGKNKLVETELEKLESLQRFIKEAKISFKNENYCLSSHQYASVCEIAFACSHLRFCLAESLIFFKDFKRATIEAERLLEGNPKEADGFCILGMIAYYQDQKETMLENFNLALRVNKNHEKTKKLLENAEEKYKQKDKGNEFFKLGEYLSALECYESALGFDETNTLLNAKIFFNIALVFTKSNKIQDAIESLNEAIVLDSKYIKAYLKRASLYQEVNEMTKAVDDLKEVLKLEPTPANKSRLQEAIKLQKNGSRKDYYKILGVSKEATFNEIKEAYKKLALKHHPDKHNDSEQKGMNEKIFKDVSEAYSLLKDSRRRERYDRGEDDGPETGFMSEDLMAFFFQRVFGGAYFYCDDDSDEDY